MATFQYVRAVCVRGTLSLWPQSPVPATCHAVEALLRHELLAHLPEWLSRKAGVLGCTSSSTILFMCWKEIFPNEDATRFELVDELLQRSYPPARISLHPGFVLFSALIMVFVILCIIIFVLFWPKGS